MGGSVAKTIGRVGSGVLTLGGSEIARNNLGSKNPISQALGLPGTILTGGASGPSQMPSLFGGGGNNPYIGGPFSLDPNQVSADEQAITGLGGKQYADTLAAIDENAKAQQTYAGQTVDRMLPGIYEDLNARHLLNSSALPTEIAQQASHSAQDIASQVAQQKLGALSGRQGFETGALQRGQSLEDFVNQANVAKTIGAQMAPQQPNGKQNFGTVASGVGALSPYAKLGKAATTVA